MSAFSLSLPCQPPVYNWKAPGSTIGNCASAFKVHSLNRVFKGSLFTNVPSSAASPHVGDLAPPLCRFLALGFCSIAVFAPLQPALAETIKQSNEEILVFTHPFARHFVLPEISPHPAAEAPHLQALQVEEDHPDVMQETLREDLFLAEKGHQSFGKSTILAEEDLQTLEKIRISSPSNVPLFHEKALFQISSSTAEEPIPFLDFAKVFSPARASSLLSDIHTLEAETGWRLRVITKSGSSSPTVSGKDLKDLWKPDEKTVIVIEDLSSPNILNFSAGVDVIVKLPRQFFLELQSRYGNQFYVQQEGEGAALVSTVQAIQECLSRPEGCKNVPGLTNDLYYLTLATSIVGGCVCGFAARLPPSGRVDASWQWVVVLSPLWLLLFVSFGILPVVGRTSELEPLLKNTLGFSAGAFALYLTPIFGPSPITKR